MSFPSATARGDSSACAPPAPHRLPPEHQLCLPHHRGSRAVVPIDRGLRNDCAPLDQLHAGALPAGCPPARRHHLVSPGDIISESAGDFVGICRRVASEPGLGRSRRNQPRIGFRWERSGPHPFRERGARSRRKGEAALRRLRPLHLTSQEIARANLGGGAVAAVQLDLFYSVSHSMQPMAHTVWVGCGFRLCSSASARRRVASYIRSSCYSRTGPFSRVILASLEGTSLQQCATFSHGTA
jgi:hypothetical protein